MKIIGITGGIGSGKSVISAELRKAGYPVYDTDSEAKRLIVFAPEVRAKVEQLLGKDVFSGNTYLTARVAERVFADRALLHQLNAIVHPAVRLDIEQQVQHVQKPFFFVESAILFESGFDSLCDFTVCVTAPEEERIRRVITRDHTDIDSVRARLRAQADHADQADLVVCNDGKTSLSELAGQIVRTFNHS